MPDSGSIAGEPTEYGYIDRNLTCLRSQLAQVCRQTGRDPAEITLLAAVKGATVGEVNYLHRHGGVDCIGENRVQQLTERYAGLDKDGLHVHFIGTLQTNKVKYIIDKVDMVESLDSVGLARELQRQACKHGRRLDVLIEVNIGREASKGGVLPEDAEALVRELLGGGYDRLRLRGFMTMAPKGDADSYHRLFGSMRLLAQELWGTTPWREEPMVLSMGMSDSYPYAVAEGATVIRVGRALFRREDTGCP